MRTVTSAWEAQNSGLTRVRIDESVLDQLLRGSSEVLWEIQALQDAGLIVETTPELAGYDQAIAVLRRAIRLHCELYVRDLADDGTASAFWSTTPQRTQTAELLHMSLYEPQILVRSRTGPLTSQQAAKLARHIGALDAAAGASLLAAEELVGLR